ncbi:MAG: hypothetical protein Q4P79_06510 [Fusobacterium sp.]|nr:hypothetical protein [Fusobacterium sp.]MDO5789100.1 hypothetical protein [Fusobacterium sp.]
MKIIVKDKNLPKDYNRQELFFGELEEYKNELKKYWDLDTSDIADEEQKEILFQAIEMNDAKEMVELLNKYNLNIWDNEDRDLEIITDERIIEKRECERTLREILKEKIFHLVVESKYFYYRKTPEDVKIEYNNGKVHLRIDYNCELYLDDRDLDKISSAESKSLFKFEFKDFILAITIK